MSSLLLEKKNTTSMPNHEFCSGKCYYILLVYAIKVFINEVIRHLRIFMSLQSTYKIFVHS